MHLVMPPSLPVTFPAHLSPDLAWRGRGAGGCRCPGPWQWAALRAAEPCPASKPLCHAPLLTADESKLEPQKRLCGCGLAAIRRTWRVSLIWFYLEVTCLLLGILGFFLT